MLPWKETSVESERLQFIERHAAGEETVAELCRRFGISRKTGYKLIGRYEAYGEGGLLDLSRAPHYHPNATPTQVVERIVEAKRRRPTWGPKKVVAWLHSIEPDVPWPSPSTASGILDRAGLVRRRKRRRRATSWGEPVNGGGILGHGAEQKCTSRSSVFSENVRLRRASSGALSGSEVGGV